MAQSKLIDKSFFDSENFEQEAKKRKDLVTPVNEFLEACEPFGFTFDSTSDLEQFCSTIDRHGTTPIYDRLVTKLMESRATIAGFEMSRQALLDSIEMPDAQPIIHALRKVRSAARDNLSVIKDLELDGNGKAYLPDAILQTLEKQHTAQAENEDQALLMSAMEQAADHIANLQSLYHDLNIESRAQSRKPLLDYVQNGHVSPEAFRIVKALK
jgi:hypothetical protein